ncbi:hypothetical protein [Brevibacillus sp. SAFN-007a]|uniref:hypothetical protein n=1 Tax=Brevibacillus sp. SAFN-007a TaxID=3436862 RepID=UPI003F7D575B
MQLKKSAIGLSLLATLALLFGGWFLYQKMEIEEPIRAEIGQMQSATLHDFHVSKDSIQIDLKVTHPEEFPAEYRSLVSQAEKIAGNKQVTIAVANQSETMTDIWERGQFVFTEAMELRQYSRIPSLVEEWKNTNQLDEATALMDDANVYVYLKKGTEDFFAILPRSEAKEVTARG